MKIKLTGLNILFPSYNEKILNVTDDIYSFKIPTSKGLCIFKRLNNIIFNNGEKIVEFRLVEHLPLLKLFKQEKPHG